MRKIDWGGAGKIPQALGQDRWGSFLPINRYFFCFLFAHEKGTRSGSLSLQSRSADYARRPSSGPSRLACTHACRRGGPSYPSGIRAWPPPYRVYQEALQPATSRSSRRGHMILGHNILGHNIHRDMHASHTLRWTPATLPGVSGRPIRACALSTDKDIPLSWN